MQNLSLKYLLMLCFITTSFFCSAQGPPHTAIQKALKEKRFADARRVLDERVAFFKKSKAPDSLVAYIFEAGKIAIEGNKPATAAKAINQSIADIMLLNPTPEIQQDAYMAAASFYESINQNEQAYKMAMVAFKLSSKVKNNQAKNAAIIESNLGTYAGRAGDVLMSEKHHRNAIAVLSAQKSPDYDRLYVSQNNMGRVMYMASKNDSSLYFFNQALNSLSKIDTLPKNRYYRPAVLQNNMSAIYNEEGRTTDAINAIRSCIKNVRIYLSGDLKPSDRDQAIHFQLEATDNLAGFYKQLGDNKQAYELLYHSYKEKVRNLINEDPDIFKSQVLLGQIFYAMKENDKARDYLSKAIERMAVADGGFLFWHADAYYTLALINDIEGAESTAQGFYEKADSLYQAAMQGNYDFMYLDFLANSSLFYAENKMIPKALKTSDLAYKYVLKTSGPDNLSAFSQLMNLAQIQYLAGNYKAALGESDSALAVVTRITRRSDNLLDSVKTGLKRPKAILLQAKIQYQLLPEKNIEGLQKILNSLQDALNGLEKRKSLLLDASDVSILMADHKELIAFVKKITLDLYNLTKDPKYAEQLISIHESGLYNRIRARLDKSEDVRFVNIPASVQQKERLLKEAVNNTLSGKGDHDTKMLQYLQAVDNWNIFVADLKTTYPRYYEMRYSKIFRQPGDVSSRLAADASVIRYFFIDSVLMAAVYNKKGMKLIDLGKPDINKDVTVAANPTVSAAELSTHLNRLYKAIWQPLLPAVKNKRITIIPDGILFNLNFEMLTPKPIRNYSELATGSILADYTISYQYSLFLTGQSPSDKKSYKNFIAFAPGFSDQIKKAYRIGLHDTGDIDNSYLSLLPQPFTTSLADKTHAMLGGDAYLYAQSTLENFKAKAGSSRIIHIGTHAEADNIHPEFSRLIFAKGNESAMNSNSLYLFDIYNCDLSSDLTVLTACESGRPGFEDGEGMVSLAHAFNYAGSESIITGLWKIDEQASAAIMDLFYSNIIEGTPKDEALRQAKLSYLKHAEGRTASPQYWAGLVLMGNTGSVQIHKKQPWVFFIAGALLLGGAAYAIARRKKKI